MAAVIDLWNQALSECGARAIVTDINEQSKEAQVCSIHYNNLRTSILRAAPWSCARFQASLTLVEDYSASPATNQYPWLYGYTYPSDCLWMRYVLEPPVVDGTVVTTGQVVPWGNPKRDNRFLPALDPTGTSKVLLTNVANAIGVYTKDITDVNLWDQGLWDAISSALCAKIAIPLGGNVQMKGTFEQLAARAINEARAQDANEAKPTTDHVPDWIAARGIPSPNLDPLSNFGFWYAPYGASMAWGE